MAEMVVISGSMSRRLSGSDEGGQGVQAVRRYPYILPGYDQNEKRLSRSTSISV
ncbi:hypothetical protein PVAP13_9NG364314 [Panicum virgatum]|uniref:Uncharacterized protein n=1 Tax=Panicum virgatum TaxID=38727 RepID=A0A8T0MUD5_PANVG|nr:hypothetical protein PVAP13_9NG364314 [Panicum virgatum]